MSGTSPIASQVMRKRLNDDCLLDGELHPNVAERLNRVRELPVSAVANLHGIERDTDGTWLIWQFIEGQTFEEYMRKPHPEGEVDQAIRGVRVAVMGMHSHGIVHGAIHPRNIIIDPLGRVRLTHVSPLLYDDPKEDLQAIDALTGKPSGMLSVAGQTLEGENLRLYAYLGAIAASVAGILIFLAILWYIRA